MQVLPDRLAVTDMPLPDAEVLIPEARRLRRRRWVVGGLLLLPVISATIWVVSGATSRGAPKGQRVLSAIHFNASAGPLSGPRVTPKSAETMTAGPRNSIYVVDTTRNQVLRWSPREGFFAVAGDGHDGDAGDGGAATHASLDLGRGSAIAVGRDGTLYIGSGDVVRAVQPDGMITTVVGGGTGSLSGSRVGARDIAIPSLGGLAVGADGELYLSTGWGIYRLDRGALVHVVGVDPQTYKWPPPPYPNNYLDTLPIRFNDASRLAFDGRGDLLVSGSDYDTYEYTAAGKRLAIANTRQYGGFDAALAGAPNGDVLIGTGRGAADLEWFESNGQIVAWNKVSSPLAHVLGRHEFFAAGDGVAVSTSGDAFADTDLGAAIPTIPAIVEIMTNGSVRTIWRG
jgi:hypothetical protein